MAIVSWRFN